MHEYILSIGGIDHTLLLDEEDAKRHPGARKAAAPTHKAEQAPNKASAPANKGR